MNLQLFMYGVYPYPSWVWSDGTGSDKAGAKSKGVVVLSRQITKMSPKDP